MLHGVGAELWRRLVDGPVPDADLSAEERLVVADMDSMGIASADVSHTARVVSVSKPWLMSPIHELVYALLHNVAVQSGVRLMFIKGPTLHAQGLRPRVHSGDVDCWIEPGNELRFARAMQGWGWRPALSAFTGTRVLHALTLRPNEWSCAVDVHSWFPGMTAAPQDAFDTVYRASEQRLFASVRALTPSTDFHAVIGSLNEVRPLRGRSISQAHIEAASSALRRAGSPAIAAAEAVGAEFALANALPAAFPDHEFDFAGASIPPDWAWRLERTNLRAYIAALRIVPVRERPRVIFRVIWPTEESLLTGPFSDDAATTDVRRLRFRRGIQALRELQKGLLRR